MRNLGFS